MPLVGLGAALMLEASDGKLGPKSVHDLLRLTATDMTVRRIPGAGFEPLKRGFDFDSGFGFVDATRAVCTARLFFCRQVGHRVRLGTVRWT